MDARSVCYYQLMDVHGTGAQRSDPKTGDPNNYPYGHGPQGDEICIYNYVRLVRDANTLTGVGNKQNQPPQQFELKQNYPNPFNPTTHITFQIAVEERVTLKIYNSLGQLVRIMLDNKLNGGEHIVSWDGLDYHCQQVSSGIYFYELKSDDYREQKKSDIGTMKELFLLVRLGLTFFSSLTASEPPKFSHSKNADNDSVFIATELLGPPTDKSVTINAFSRRTRSFLHWQHCY